MGKAYVIEMKAVEKAVSAETAAKNAMRQIIDRGYADSYVNPPILMSLAVAQDTRNIAACVFVKDGRADKLEFPVPLKKALKRQVDDKFDIKDVNSLSAVTQEKRMARAPRP
jgi:hypothetical protein